MTSMKVTQLVIQKPENMAGISISFESGGRVVIEAHDPMVSALQPTPMTPRKANEIPIESDPQSIG